MKVYCTICNINILLLYQISNRVIKRQLINAMLVTMSVIYAEILYLNELYAGKQFLLLTEKKKKRKKRNTILIFICTKSAISKEIFKSGKYSQIRLNKCKHCSQPFTGSVFDFYQELSLKSVFIHRFTSL